MQSNRHPGQRHPSHSQSARPHTAWPRRTLLAALASLPLVVGALHARPAHAAAALGCLIEPDRIAEVGSPVIGVIDSVEVERGEVVHKGQILATLHAGVEKAALEVARQRADANADLQAAAANASFNRERLQRAEDLYKQSFISQQALDQARTESRLADQKLAQARELQAVTVNEKALAAAQLSQRVIRSPMDGVVAERYMSAGERADDKPLLRIARIDPLRVHLVVPTTLYGQLRADGVVSVVPDLPGAAPVDARVSVIDKVVDPASNTFRVQLTLPNPDRSLPAGLRCKADIAASGTVASPLPAMPANGFGTGAGTSSSTVPAAKPAAPKAAAGRTRGLDLARSH